MKRVTHNRLAFGTALLVVTLGLAFATYGVAAPTPMPNSAIVFERVFNDCPTSTLTTTNNYPSLISFEDANVDCFGFANLHVWHFSDDGGVTDAVFDNNASYRVAMDFKIEGDGNGEGGIQIAPWWAHNTDGLFNVRSTDGEIACFAGRLPFFSFTNDFGLHYTKGDVIHLEVIYEPRALSAARPATIEYRVAYNGGTYTSGPLPFDMGNPLEDPPYGLWGELNDARVGGHFKAFLGNGVPVTVKATFSNIKFTTTPVANSVVTVERVFNDCPTSTLTTVNNYPWWVSFHDENLDCFGFANLHVWRFSENGVDPAIFNNNAAFRFSSDFMIDGSGNGEGGLQIAPWWSKLADGLFNVRSTDGEIACFAGRLPFFSFTNDFGLHYAKGDNIHLEMVYDPHTLLGPADPATVEYRVGYNGSNYTSGPLPFDMANPLEDPPYGLWGMLNDGQAGGHFKAFLGNGVPVDVQATFRNIHYSTCLDPVPVTVDIKPDKLNLKSKSKKLTVVISVPAGYDPADIDVSTLRLNGIPPMDGYPKSVKSKKIKVRFPRDEVQASMDFPSAMKSQKIVVPLWVSGAIGNECFDSKDLVTVKVPKLKKPHPEDIFAVGQVADVEWNLFTDDPNPATVSLLASVDDGATWTVQAAGIPNSGHYAWVVPEGIAGAVRLSVAEVYEVDQYGPINQVEYGESDLFTIQGALAVDPGTQVGLQLYGSIPNPSRGLAVAFALPRADKATLSVFDITGRLVKSIDVGALGAGRHTVSISDPGTLRAGVYLVRLTQGAQTLNARAVVVQ